jgi:pilus assembly protein CpaF
MVLMAGFDLPVRAIREQIASALHLIMQVDRMPDGRRVVTSVTEVQGMEGDVILLQDVFKYVPSVAINGKPSGELRATGLRPKFLEKLGESGVELPAKVFHAPSVREVVPVSTTRLARTAVAPSAAELADPERAR